LGSRVRIPSPAPNFLNKLNGLEQPVWTVFRFLAQNTKSGEAWGKQRTPLCFPQSRCRPYPAAALLSLDAEAAETSAQEGYELAQELGRRPEQAHGMRTLGDIMAAKNNTTKADEFHWRAHVEYRSLGMNRWAERPS
jgi:hypothetical protein